MYSLTDHQSRLVLFSYGGTYSVSEIDPFFFFFESEGDPVRGLLVQHSSPVTYESIPFFFFLKIDYKISTSVKKICLRVYCKRDTDTWARFSFSFSMMKFSHDVGSCHYSTVLSVLNGIAWHPIVTRPHVQATPSGILSNTLSYTARQVELDTPRASETEEQWAGLIPVHLPRNKFDQLARKYCI